MAAKGFQEYYRPAEYKGFKSMKDVYVTGRDGTRLCIDIYIPNGEGPFPALLSFGQHNKDLAERRQDPAKCPNPVPCNVCSKTVRECPLAVWLPEEKGQ